MLLIGNEDPTLRLLVNTVIMGMICGGAFALAALPQAVVGFMVPLIAGSAIFMITDAGPVNGIFAIMFGILTAIIMAGSLLHSKMLIRRVAAELEAREKTSVIELLLKSFEENSSDWLWRIDAERRLRDVSSRFAEAAGTDQKELEGASIQKLLKKLQSLGTAAAKDLLLNIRARRAFKDVTIPISLGGQQLWWRVTGEPCFDETGAYIGYRGVASDVTDTKLAEQRLSYLAHFDPLTGLVNRASFYDLIADHFAQSRSGSCFAVHFIDLDQFKAVNDTMGHAAGDRLLEEIAARFSSVVAPPDTLARLGGDEFAVLQRSGTSTDAAAALAQRLIDASVLPVEVNGDIFRVSASIGIAMAPSNGADGETLLRSADLALYQAKDAGRSTFCFFHTGMDDIAQERRLLGSELASALEAGELCLHFQPLIAAGTGEPAGFEALLRWQHPTRGLVPPSTFIPIAEQTGLIKAIGGWVIEEACRTASSWPEHLKVAVNLSPAQFEGSSIVEAVRSAITEARLDPQRLELEITESLFIAQPEDVLDKLRQLKGMGISVAMDDFGTGYSSLSYLWKFPFDRLKMDRSFVSAIEHDRIACDILRAISSLGRSLGMSITAEGVETEAQAKFLQGIGCDQLQGFLFSRPLPVENMPVYFLQPVIRRHRGEAGAQPDAGLFLKTGNQARSPL
ncbi:putative bifunctional diguanylate cyclase/phosphodiesterase [Tianweitania sediminis]|uniref:EAL domain-containing protein n=1 Tax=Tianweitania sediminis TaxID=1502156 RepID=A0A8J7UHY6_9HYPH|nr:EAL domain-containing protein [Tianweitania sediminis]MBP0437205.1 EAL domain-containing protein [Tianweitania sediminis]